MKKVLKAPLYFLVAILVLLLAIVYIYYFTNLPEQRLNDWLANFTSGKLGLEISFRNVNRDVWNRLSVDGVEISSPANNGAVIASIPHLEINYSISDLLHGEYRFSSVSIDTLYATIPTEGIRLPSPKGGRRTSGASNLSLQIGQIAVGAARIHLPKYKEEFTVDSLESSLSVNKGEIQIDLFRLSGDWPSHKARISDTRAYLLIDQNGIQLDTLNFRLGQSHVAISGRIKKPYRENLDLHFSFAPLDFDDVKALTGVNINGNLTGSGTLVGAIDDFSGQAQADGFFVERPITDVRVTYALANKKLRVDSIQGGIFEAAFNGSGSVNFGVKPEQYAYRGQVEHLDLRQIGPQIRTDFTGYVNLKGSGFNARNFSMALDCALNSVRIETYYFDEVSGPIKFDLDQLDFLPGFNGRYKNTFIDMTGYLRYNSNLDLTGQVDFEDLTDFTNQIFIKQLGGKGTADFHATGPTVDFNATAHFASDSCWTYGLVPGHIEIYADLESFISHRVGFVEGAWKGGALYSVQTDSGYFYSGVSGERAFIDSVFVDSPIGGVKLTGEYNGTSIPPTMVIDNLYGHAYRSTFYSKKPIVFNVNPTDTEFKQFLLGFDSGAIEVTGAVTNDLDMNLNVLASGFQIQPFVEQVYKDKILKGMWSGTAVLTGNFQSPTMDFDLQIDSFSIDNTPIGRLLAKAEYQDGYLRTRSMQFVSEHGEYDFSGSLPVDLSFAEAANRFPDKPVDFQMVASGNRLLLAEVFIPTVERFDTDFDVRFNLSGTYSKPRITGVGVLSDGELKVIDLVNPLTDLRAYMRMENTTIFIDSVFANVPGGQEWVNAIGELWPRGKKEKDVSWVKAYGTMKLLRLGEFQYDITAKGRNVFFYADAYDVRGLADLDLKITGNTPPTVGGDVALKRLEVRDEFDRFIAPDFDPNLVLEDSTLWNLDFYVSSTNNLWIKNTDVDAEFKGDLLVQRQVGILRILGSLDVIRGRYTLIGQPFTVKTGSMRFNDVKAVNPDIDFTVTTRLRSQAGLAGISPLTPVELHITGTLLEPDINIGSQTGTALTREDLLRYLIAGSQVNPFTGQSNFSKNLTRNLLPTISTFIPDPLITGGLVEELEIYQSEQGDPQISVAKYISRSLYVRYSQRLSQQSGRTIGVEYYLNNNASFHVTRGLQGSPNEGISLDFNLNFEY